MPTNEERREVAGKIKRNALNNPNMPLILNVAFAAFGFTGCSEKTVTASEAGLRLAELIEPEPKRTGHAVEDLSIGGYVSWRCSECGQPINKADNYCSNCGVRLGAKAVE
jgi:hypothetical protein